LRDEQNTDDSIRTNQQQQKKVDKKVKGEQFSKTKLEK